MNIALLPPRPGGPVGGPGVNGGAGGVTGWAELNGLPEVNPDGEYPPAWVGLALTV